MHIIETQRLVLCKLTLDDAPFIYKLVNDPDWLRYIGDRNVHNINDAKNYLMRDPLPVMPSTDLDYTLSG